MNNISKNFNNGILVIDTNYKVIYANDVFMEFYPTTKVGEKCHMCLHDMSEPCSYCPLFSDDDKDRIVYNVKRRSWFTSFISKIFIEKYGDCYVFTVKENLSKPLKQNDEENKIAQSLNEKSAIEYNEYLDKEFPDMPYGFHCYLDKPGFPFLHISKRFCQIVGYSKEEIQELFDNKMANMLHPDSTYFNDNFKNFIDNDKDNGFNEAIYRLKSKKGYIWVLESSKLFEENGLKFFQGAITDITSLMETQIKNNNIIIKSESKMSQYKKAIVSKANAIYEVNVTKDILESASFFQNGKEFPISAYHNIQMPCTYSWYVNNMSQRVDKNHVKNYLYFNNIKTLMDHYKEGNLEWQVEYEINSQGKEYKTIRKNFILTENPANKDIHALIVTRDITDKLKIIKENEVILKTQKEALSLALEKAEQRLKIIDSLCREYYAVLFVDVENDIYTPYLASSKSPDYKIKPDRIPHFRDNLNNYIESVVLPGDIAHVKDLCSKEKINAVLEKDGKYDVKFKIVDDCLIEHVQMRILKIGEGEQIWALRSIENIVQEEFKHQKELQSALENAQKAERAKTTFLYNMSHDIRTPMNAIIGFNQMAQNHIDNKEDALSYLNKSEVASKHLLNLINEVLETARIEKGKIDIHSKLVNINSLFDEIVSMFQSSMEEKKINFVTKINYQTEFVYLDSTKTMEVLTNLLGNAQKFTKPNGKIIFSVKEVPMAKSKKTSFEIHVKDTGIGISPEFQKKLFKAFERENNSTISGITGTGLGLSIAKNIANALGGSLTCKSKVGKGSDFTFKFVAKKAVEKKEKTTKTPSSTVKTCSNSQEKRILIVEDNPLNREIATDILSGFGFIIETADDGTVAVEKVKNSKPGFYDVILMDVQMPIMNGYTATSKIRALKNTKLASIPIVAMTANAFQKDREKSLEAGMNDHITKPIDFNKLVTIIKRLVD